MTELLLKNGANPNISTSSGDTPLHLVLLTAPLKRKGDNTTSFIVGMIEIQLLTLRYSRSLTFTQRCFSFMEPIPMLSLTRKRHHWTSRQRIHSQDLRWPSKEKKVSLSLSLSLSLSNMLSFLLCSTERLVGRFRTFEALTDI